MKHSTKNQKPALDTREQDEQRKQPTKGTRSQSDKGTQNNRDNLTARSPKKRSRRALLPNSSALNIIRLFALARSIEIEILGTLR